MDDLVTIIVERLDKEKKAKLTETDRVFHIQGRGLDEYYKITGNREDLNYEWWLEETIKNFYSAHLNVLEKIEVIYIIKDKSKL